MRFSQVVSQTELVLLEEIGHLPHFTRPEAVIDAVDEGLATGVAQRRVDLTWRVSARVPR